MRALFHRRNWWDKCPRRGLWANLVPVCIVMYCACFNFAAAAQHIKSGAMAESSPPYFPECIVIFDDAKGIYTLGASRHICNIVLRKYKCLCVDWILLSWCYSLSGHAMWHHVSWSVIKVSERKVVDNQFPLRINASGRSLPVDYDCWIHRYFCSAVGQRSSTPCARQDIQIRPQLALFRVRGDSSLLGRGGCGSARGICGFAAYTQRLNRNNENQSGDEGVYPGPNSTGARPPSYLAIMLAIFVCVGFVISCIGLEGVGNAALLFGGWGIATVSAALLLIFWW